MEVQADKDSPHQLSYSELMESDNDSLEVYLSTISWRIWFITWSKNWNI